MMMSAYLINLSKYHPNFSYISIVEDVDIPEEKYVNIHQTKDVDILLAVENYSSAHNISSNKVSNITTNDDVGIPDKPVKRSSKNVSCISIV